MRVKAQIMDEAAMGRALRRIAHEIDEREPEAENYLLVGIHRRGGPLAEIIAEQLRQISNKEVQIGHLDIRYYRDDLTSLSEDPRIEKTDIPTPSTQDHLVILVDDVIYTGRTARAAMDAIIDEGRPSAIRLACLIDRGHREMPIRPDFVGKNVPTSRSEQILVQIPPYEEKAQVLLVESDDKDKKKQ